MSEFLPDQVQPVEPEEEFAFCCHRRVSCFTECCRELELALTPYDVLRLRKATSLHSARLHERYIIEDQDSFAPFPSFYLTMVDDGRASCVFVRPKGCSVYPHRPGACRSYPLGRGTVRQENQLQERFVLLSEPHCRGFEQTPVQTAQTYMESQGLAPYNRFNDLLTEITQHEQIRQGMKPGAEQIRHYKLALFDLDTFREKLQRNELHIPAVLRHQPQDDFDDESLLEFSMNWFKTLLFGHLNS
jgi:hypothetical protein